MGHPGRSRERSEPDVTIECKVESCLACGQDLRDSAYREVGRSQVIELPPVKPVVEAIRYACECPACGKQQAATYQKG